MNANCKTYFTPTIKVGPLNGRLSSDRNFVCGNGLLSVKIDALIPGNAIRHPDTFHLRRGASRCRIRQTHFGAETSRTSPSQITYELRVIPSPGDSRKVKHLNPGTGPREPDLTRLSRTVISAQMNCKTEETPVYSAFWERNCLNLRKYIPALSILNSKWSEVVASRLNKIIK